jgi:hypothetical protein
LKHGRRYSSFDYSAAVIEDMPTANLAERNFDLQQDRYEQ